MATKPWSRVDRAGIYAVWRNNRLDRPFSQYLARIVLQWQTTACFLTEARRNCRSIAKELMMDNRAKQVADKYRHLGGRRLAAFDDNNASTRSWERDTPEAETFWQTNIASLSERERAEVQSFLPSIIESDEPGKQQ